MQKHLDLTLGRLANFKVYLERALYSESLPISMQVFSPGGRIPFAEAIQGDYNREVKIGDLLGEPWSTHWVKIGFEVPSDWQEKEVHLLWNSRSEAAVWTPEGSILQGLSFDHRRDFALEQEHYQGKQTLYLEVACNHLFGIGQADLLNQAGPVDAGTLSEAAIKVFNRDVWDLLWDFTTIQEMAQFLHEDNPRRKHALRAANSMINAIEIGNPATYKAGRDLAAKFLQAKNGDETFKLSCVGHAHIDTAWLWPVAESRRKCYRTFSSAVRYMDEYPEYKFVCSQSIQWEWIKNDHPELFEKMKTKIKTGQFLPVGGSCVEPDCNIPSGESLVRQFLIGQMFFEDELNYKSEVFWQPDVFGYSAQLPQIMKGVEINYFLTQKLSWNQFNRLPHHTFNWEGLDGTEVLTHFPPGDNYNSFCTVDQVVYNTKNYKDHEKNTSAMYIYGYGDGGGGPTKEMLERLRRMKNVAGLTKMETKSPETFFKNLENESIDLCRWVGELYLELHRGTYTSQAKTKLNNRRCEDLFNKIEFLASLTNIDSYPAESLKEMWKTVLVNQFHDIIPGSSIQEVYNVCDVEYNEVLTTGGELMQNLVSGLAQNSGDNILVVNSSGFARRELTTAPNGELAVVSAPASGYAITQPEVVEQQATVVEAADSITLENSFVRAQFNKTGQLENFYDIVNDREIVVEAANKMVIYDDQPNYWDAWDVDAFHLEKSKQYDAISAKVVATDKLQVAVEFTYKFDHSTMTQRVSLSAISGQLDFDCCVDWHETNKFLKVEFPTNFRAMEANFEIQFGHLSRKTHSNTSWDLAQFEVCAQRWMDISEPDYGVALLNDSKYGCACHGSVMSLSLLRSPKRPDPECDMGEQRFKFALYPHSGSLQQGGVIEAAKAFNSPLLTAKTNADLTSRSWFTVNKPGLLIDTVKKAEKSDDIILRLYEAYGQRGKFKIDSSLDIVAVSKCNLLERQDVELDISNGIELTVRPFEIVTLKVTTK